MSVRTTLQEKIRANSVPDEAGCWLWLGGLDAGGYGQTTVDGKNRRAHRIAYESYVGPVPDGLQLDHLCRVRRCVNPQHLEPVTPSENTRRGWAARGLPEVCGNGHLWAENTLMVTKRDRHGEREVRECRACNTARTRRRRGVVRDEPVD